MQINLAHWQIETNHWLLDVALNEDKQTARKGNACQNLSALRRFAIAIQKAEQQDTNKETTFNKFIKLNRYNIKRTEKLLFTTKIN